MKPRKLKTTFIRPAAQAEDQFVSVTRLWLEERLRVALNGEHNRAFTAAWDLYHAALGATEALETLLEERPDVVDYILRFNRIFPLLHEHNKLRKPALKEMLKLQKHKLSGQPPVAGLGWGLPDHFGDHSDLKGMLADKLLKGIQEERRNLHRAASHSDGGFEFVNAEAHKKHFQVFRDGLSQSERDIYDLEPFGGDSLCHWAPLVRKRLAKLLKDGMPTELAAIVPESKRKTKGRRDAWLQTEVNEKLKSFAGMNR